MITIHDVEEVLARHPFLKAPAHVIIVKEPIEYTQGVKKILFAGMSPSWRRDTIILSSLATQETVIHEVIHTYGLGETAAWGIAPRLYSIRRRLPNLFRRQVKYARCTGCEEYRVLHEKYSGRAEHWVRVR